jgi:NAD(P)-dependent dehydrogenase (short-subunit alcohol dehydrogenase family)
MTSPAQITLKNRVAIITGAGRGLGRAYALEFAGRGAAVVVNDAGLGLRGDQADEEQPADVVVREISAAGGRAVASHHDISKAEEARALVDLAVAHFNGVDIVVNNAGTLRHAILQETTLEDMQSMLDVHVLGAFALTQAAYPHMVAQRYGRIVLTTSQVGFYGKLNSIAYGMAKNAVIGMMHGIKLDAARHGIMVNCISPFASTRMATAFPAEVMSMIDPAQVAAALAWMCSEDCTLQGEIVIAGGGHFARACTMESRGIDIATPEALTAETIAQRWGEIASMSGALTYADALEAVGATFDGLKRRAGLM